MMGKFEVNAYREDVIAVLQAALTPEEMAQLRIDGPAKPNPLAPAPRRAEPASIATTVLWWVGEAVAAGITYDVLKALAVKAKDALEARFGADRVKKDDTTE